MPKQIAIDGLDVLIAEIGLREIASLIERTARWVSPETFRYLPIWFPEKARRKYFYKANWSEPQLNRNRTSGDASHKFEGNTGANQALTLALGLRKQTRPNWSCCHIWGIDDPSYQKSNSVVSDHRYYSCVANMVLLPTPLKAFTDNIPQIKAMLRICARNLYRWQCDHPDMMSVNQTLDTWNDWDAYPKSWPKRPDDGRPTGVVETTTAIKLDADRRLACVRRDLASAGERYPREDVRKALSYWGISEDA